ncbi:MAG: IS110 family transposase [Pseudomonadota bacterium]
MENVFGVDVAKNWIDIVGPDGHERVGNEDLKAFAQRVGKRGSRVAFEASGGYETPLRAALAKAGVPAIRINPRRARAFANSLGRLAKTDRADAGMIREMAMRLDLPECPPEPKEVSQLKALQLRRRQLVEDAKREKIRLSQTSDKAMRASLGRVLRLLRREIKGIETAIAKCIAASKELRNRAALLRTAPGVGPVSATALMAEMPELGTLAPRQVAALAGLAPMARDSGLRTAQTSDRRRPQEPSGRALYGGSECRAKRPIPARFLGQTQSKRQSPKASHHRCHTKTPHHPQRHDPGKQAICSNLNNTLARGYGGWPPISPAFGG